MQKTPDFQMPIITERLLIRPPEIEDVKILNDAIIESFNELHFWMAWAKEKQTLQQTEEYIRSSIKNWVEKKNDEPYLPLSIFDRHTNEFIGAAGFHHFNWDIPSIETGYWIRTSYSGKGMMTEAINAHTRYALTFLKMKKIIITCDPDNISSRKIPERLGYTLESIL